MTDSEKILFESLKKAVADQFLKGNQAPEKIESWKGEEIVAFQEDLFEKTKGKVSEKWFYTYIKNEPEKLPRIDILNLLSQYAGFSNWNTFRTEQNPAIKTPKRSYYWLLLMIIPLGIALYFIFNKSYEYEFCMVDANSNLAITDMVIDIKVLIEGQSPVHFKTDSSGCFQYRSKEKYIRFVVQSPYHKTDTIIRQFSTSHNSVVKVNNDDYAMMLRYYSNGNLKEWKKRREQLGKLFADEAQIYRVFPGQSGVELYSKDEFINKLTTPTSSLKNIQVLQREYSNGRIIKLKFSIQ